MRFYAIPHKDMPAKINIPKTGATSRISKIEGWNIKDLKHVPKNKKGALIKYNPSITLINKTKKYCDYIMWYRATLPCKNKGKRPLAPREPPYNSTMWDSDWNLCWDGAGISTIRVFNDGSVEVKSDSIPVSETSHVLDARLVFWRDNFHIIYNRYTKYKPFPNSNPELENCPSYGGGLCITMETHPIKITKKNIYSLDSPRVLCRDKHTRFEKNWSLVLPIQSRRLIHYSFTPQMKFLESSVNNDPNKDTCSWKISPNSDFFLKLFKYYKDVLPPLVANGIAVTTPLIDFDKQHWIGIGRVKVDYKKMILDSNNSMKNTKLGKFMNLLRTVLGIPNVAPKDWFKFSPHIHSTLLYFSFFYTVNKKTLAIGQFSPAYLPQCPDVNYFASITFPVSIQPFTKNNFAISLGIADIDCGIITISRKEIRKMLTYSNKTKPSDFDFQIQTFENPLPHFQS